MNTITTNLKQTKWLHLAQLSYKRYHVFDMMLLDMLYTFFFGGLLHEVILTHVILFFTHLGHESED